MLLIGILLIVFSVICFVCSGSGFGDIGLAFAFIGISSLLSGIGLIAARERINKIGK